MTWLETFIASLKTQKHQMFQIEVVGDQIELIVPPPGKLSMTPGLAIDIAHVLIIYACDLGKQTTILDKEA